MECSFVVAWTVQGPCIDCPELNDQLPAAVFDNSFECLFDKIVTYDYYLHI